MPDVTTAPTCAIGQVSPETAARWPLPEEWPAPDAPTLAWARFYLVRLRLRVLPTPSPQDRLSYAAHLNGEACEAYRDDHAGAEPPPDVATQFWDDARAMAEDLRGPIPKIAAGWGNRPVTDANLVAWFSPAPGGGLATRKTQHHLERGVCCILGDRGGLAQVDVDPRHGGYILGEYATLPGPHVHTPRGGIHGFVDLSALRRGERVYSSANTLAPGVEVRTTGFAVLPSGATSPGRKWVGRDAPHPPPLALLRPPPRPVRATATAAQQQRPGPYADGDGWRLDDGDEPRGRVASILASEIGRGDGRTAAAQAIVGMLAAPRSVPEDVLDAALAMLVEYGAGRDWTPARVAEECATWRALLTRGPRDAEFAAEVVSTWVATRDVGPVRKSAAWARATARSTWKTADRRQDGTAGAEDLGLAALVGARDPVPDPWADDPPRHARDYAASTPLPPSVVTASARSDVTAVHPLPDLAVLAAAAPSAVDGLAASVSAGDEAGQRAIINEIRLRRILPTIGQAYPLESIRRDVASTPVRVECLYPFLDFVTHQPEVADDVLGPSQYHVQVGHGYGRDLASAVGGIREGDFKAFGAAGAKGGKTHFLGQLVEGLALCTAARILGVPGYASCPIVMPVWVSEMPKEGEVLLRMMARLFGFDSAAIADGTSAAEARGIVHMAAQYHGALPPSKIVRLAVGITEVFSQDENHPAGLAIQKIIREIDLSELPNPKGTGRQRVDYRSGPNLIGFIADATDIYRRDLANLAGVPEDKVLPLVLLDPGQRFAGDSENSKAELDALLGAVVARICRRRSGLGGACIMTSDTTKAAARDLDVDRFLSEPSGQKLAADIFAGSQAIMHHCDVFAVCGDDSLGDFFRRTQWVRVLQGRTGASAECYPFSWETHTGRFRPRPAEALRAASEDPRGGGGGRPVGRRGGGRSWSPSSRSASSPPPPAEPASPPPGGYFPNYVPGRYGPDAD